ncbi:MAG TPA: glycoside hydrolase family 5 protein [Amycolatopsis sp.]|nr:glycoside hydrolase family 5 protein [Amycolatopsis sp.]
MSGFLRTDSTRVVDEAGNPVRLLGVGLGGWMNMENFITGYAANESMMRAEVARVLGAERAEGFFDRLLDVFFTDADAELLARAGMNSVRIPVNYRHFEQDSAPFTLLEKGFERLDRVIASCARHGLYTIIDLHALPGAQNHHWHSDNPTHVPLLWQHPHFQDRAVHLWEALADRYRDNPWVAGYNPINEPADESRTALGPFSQRLLSAIRAIDPRHILFLDGNTYSTEFDVFTEPWDNVVYTCHDYASAGLTYGGPYPGFTRGTWVDRDVLEQKFRQRTEYCRRTGTPIWVGEFGPVYTGKPEVDEQRYRILEDQLDIYRRYDASWSIWTYKDIGLQGLVTVSPDSPYLSRFSGFVAKKARLGADKWGATGREMPEVTLAVQELMAREFPEFSPYPWGREDWTRTLLMNILYAQPLTVEYAELFRGLSDEDLSDLADSFTLDRCVVRERLVDTLKRHAG